MNEELGFGLALYLQDNFTQPAGRAEKAYDSLDRKFEKAATRTFLLNELGNAIGNLQNGLALIEGPGSKFDYTLSEVSAITGVAGKGLDDLAERAKVLAEEFGTGSVENLNMFKTILSRLGPEIAESPAALTSMANSVNTLSKTMSGDVLGATDALTTSVNIYASDITDAAERSRIMVEQMNAMAAGAQYGSAEVPQIAESIKVAGLAAKSSGVQFEELNGLIQVMGLGSKYGAEAGTALRNVLLKMSQGRYMPKQAREGLEAAGIDLEALGDASIPVINRLRMLERITGDSALMTEFFGVENANAGRILLGNLGAFEKFTDQITGTNSATEQAAVVMESWSERANRMKAFAENLAISFFNATKEVTPFLHGLLGALQIVVTLGPAVQALSLAFTALSGTEVISAFTTFGFAGGVEYLTLRMGELAASAWAALAPLLPYVAVAAAIAGAVMLGAYAIDEFGQMARGATAPAEGLEGVLQGIGGVLSGIGDLWSTGALSAETATGLDKLGLREYTEQLWTWVEPIQTFWESMKGGFRAVYVEFQKARDIIRGFFEPVTTQFEKFDLAMKESGVDLEMIATAGRYAAYAITAAITIMLAPLIIVTGLIYGVVQALRALWYAAQRIPDAWDWLTDLPGRFLNFGASIVDSMIEGVASQWDRFANYLTELIGQLPGGEAIVNFLAGDKPQAATQPRGLSVPLPSISGIAAQTEAARASAFSPTIVTNNPTVTTQTVVPVSLDGREITRVVSENLAFESSRK